MPVSLLYETTNNYSNFSKGLARVILLGEGKGSTVWLKYFAQQNSKITQLGLKCEEVFKFRVRISTAWLFHVSFVFLLYNFFMPLNLNPVYLSEHILCTCTLMILNFEDPEWNVNLFLQYPGCQQIGFLLGSCGVSWALTSETCLKSLPKDDTGHVCTFKGKKYFTGFWLISNSLARAV